MRFIAVEVDAGPAHDEGLSLRFKRAGDAPARAVAWVDYASDAGLEGRWRLFTADTPDGEGSPGAAAALVEDSSDGTVWLVTGGRHGVILVHEATGARERAPYLAVSQRTPLG